MEGRYFGEARLCEDSLKSGLETDGVELTDRPIARTSERDYAVQESRKRYPDANGSTLNCCSSAESIWTKASSEKRPEGYDDLFLYIPEARQIIRIAEGTGDNLLEEDTDTGYVDYIYYDQYMLDVDMPNVDGGMVLLKEMLREKYGCLADCIPDVLDMAYGSSLVGYRILG